MLRLGLGHAEFRIDIQNGAIVIRKDLVEMDNLIFRNHMCQEHTLENIKDDNSTVVQLASAPGTATLEREYFLESAKILKLDAASWHWLALIAWDYAVNAHQLFLFEMDAIIGSTHGIMEHMTLYGLFAHCPRKLAMVRHDGVAEHQFGSVDKLYIKEILHTLVDVDIDVQLSA